MAERAAVRTNASSLTEWTATTRIRLSVIVPVLSVRITVALPRVSAARSRLIRKFSFESTYALRPRVIVMMIGSSSGMVAKARASPVRMLSSSDWPRRNPASGIMTEKKMATKARVLESDFMASCSAVFGGLIICACAAISPIRVFPPVVTASSSPSPARTSVPEKTSPPSSFSTGNDSPVREDSSTRRLTDDTRQPSAAIRVPGTSTSRSPGTTPAVGIPVMCPFRTTFVSGAAMVASEAIAFFARYSVPISTRTRVMMIA